MSSSLEITYKTDHQIKQELVDKFNKVFEGKEKPKVVKNRLRPNLLQEWSMKFHADFKEDARYGGILSDEAQQCKSDE